MNMFNLPLIQIISFDIIQKSFFAFFAFIYNEEKESYRWVLNCVRTIYNKYRLEYPRTLITDRDPALGAAIKKVKTYEYNHETH